MICSELDSAAASSEDAAVEAHVSADQAVEGRTDRQEVTVAQPVAAPRESVDEQPASEVNTSRAKEPAPPAKPTAPPVAEVDLLSVENESDLVCSGS